MVCDIVHCRLDTYFDDIHVRREQYGSLDEMVEDVLPYLDFDELVSVSDEEMEELEQRLTAAFDQMLQTGAVEQDVQIYLEK